MSDKPAWNLRRDDDGLAWLSIDKPDSSANTLGKAVLLELDGLLDELAGQPPRALVVISGKSSGFIAGADIREFTAMKDEEEAYRLARRGQEIFARIESLPYPTVAAIHGFALGGGLELALAFRYRIAVDDDKLSLGLPEVQLGLQPGFGGSVRTVHLVGVRAAMQMLLTGKPQRGAQALRTGLVDQLVKSRDELATAARALALNPPPRRHAPLLDQLLCWPLVRLLLKPALVKQVAAAVRADHYPAPYAMIDQWAGNGAYGERAYEDEARSLARLMLSPAGKGLVRVFMLQDRLKSLGKKPARPLEKVHVIGAGVMGGDIAAWCALRGLQVTLQDRELKYIEPALKRAAELYQKRLKTAELRQAASGRLRADVAGDGAAGADVVIEAIFENLEAKQQLFQTVEARAPAHALLATNTSSITLEAIAAALPQPARLAGLHFFNPVAAMPLIEVIQGKDTDPAQIATALAFARRLDKLPVPVHSGPGFLVNRVLFPYLHEAFFAAGEGVPLEIIDRAAVDFGMPMGPIELSDVVGLDVLLHVGEIITRDLRRETPPLVEKLRTLVNERKLGRKSGQGFYSWVDGKVRKNASAGAVPEGLGDRLLLPLLNECVACLREGIVEDADLVDAGVLFGTGFAPFRGGPLFYARERGIERVVEALRAHAVRHGSRFAPDAGWATLANWRTR
jgi:3-hydroxyacyl-CoA dehydrogenase / enoyl-CoA hydratase / 3-hydroxybutyryl-CoA epimerase